MSEASADRILPPRYTDRISGDKLRAAQDFAVTTELQRQVNRAEWEHSRKVLAYFEKLERRRKAQADAASILIPDVKALTDNSDAEYDSTHNPITDRLERFERAHRWALGQAATMETMDWGQEGHDIADRANRLRTCGTYLVFRELVDSLDGDNRITTGAFCQQCWLCPLCAIRKAAKSVQAVAPVVIQCCRDEQAVPMMFTGTVKNGSDLAERLDHLHGSLRAWLKKRREGLSKANRSACVELCKVVGGRYSIECKRGRDSGLWHPHFHAVFLVPGGVLDCDKLRDEWKAITGDSHIVHLQPMQSWRDALHATDPMQAVELMAGDLVEVLKYPLKFGDLSHEDTWEVYKSLRKDRARVRPTSGSFGCLRGVEVEEGYLDAPLDYEDIPYIEVIARWLGNGYHVERGDDWTMNGDDSDAYYRWLKIHADQPGGFSEAKTPGGSGDTGTAQDLVQVSPQGASHV